MSDSLFWQEGFPKDRRVELVATLLYSGDPDARIPGDEGLRPDRVEDFYRTVGFSSRGDFDHRLEEVQNKYRYGDVPAEALSPAVQVPTAPHALPSADPFAKFFVPEKPNAPTVEVPVAAVSEVKARRPRKPRATVPEQPIIPVPVRHLERVAEAPIVEVAPVLSPVDAQLQAIELHAEERVSAFARGVLTWFGRKPRTAERFEGAGDGADSERMREAVSELLAKELGSGVFDEDVADDSKTKAHIEAANRLERAVSTSVRLDTKARKIMKERVGELRATYQRRTQDMARARSGELQEGPDKVVARQTQDYAHSALRVLATRKKRVADDLNQFRGQIEHAAVQRGGAASVAAVDEAFREAWAEVWGSQSANRETLAQRGMNAVEALEIVGASTGKNAGELGALAESLPRLRLLEGDRNSGIARLVLAARASIQEEIDRVLPGAERAMKRAA